MNITGYGDMAVYETPEVTLFSRESALVAQEVQLARAAVAAETYGDMYFIVRPTGVAGEIAIKNVAYFFNQITGFKDPVTTSPLIWPDLEVVIPENKTGAVYFEFAFNTMTPIAAFYETYPERVDHIYYRPIADVSRANNSDTVTITQRHLGVLTIPSEDTANVNQGLL
jgi:hypothetical protein